jgi:BolA protein
MHQRIERRLRAAFDPCVLEVANESALHAGHAGHREAGGGAETHFCVRIVASAFEGMSRIERHRRVHEALEEELRGGVHALALTAEAPARA